MAVENYHLKWDSHVSYLNSSVATLYKNEKFADVVLYSSNNGSSSNSNSNSSSSNSNNCNNAIDNAIPTVGISAHKFILSSCSQFFATLFDNTPIPASNGVLYVVLPPELSHRAIQILVQYIYTGEATVSNDILNEVLRGGEILKIRGLCRTASQRESTTNSSSINNNNNNNNSSCSNSIHYGTNGTRPQHMLPPTVIHGSTQHPGSAHTNDLYGGNKCTAQVNQVALGLNGGCSAVRYGIEQLSHTQSSIHSQIRGLGASVMPKDSPVIVKSPKLSQMGQLPSSRENKHHGSGITVNKEVAIDPDENCCYQAAVVPTILQHDPLQLPLPPPPQTLVSIGSGSLCSDVGCKNCSYNNAAEPEKQRSRQRHLSQSDELPHRLPGIERLEREFSDERCETSEIHLNYSSRRSRNSNERVSNYFVTDHYDPANQSQAHLIAAVKTPKQYDHSVSTPTTAATAGNSNIHSPTLYPHNFLTIKQEPVDWTTPQSNPTETTDDMVDRPPMTTSPHPISASSPKQPLDFKIPVGNATTVKIEAGITSSHSTDEDEMATGSAIGQYSNFSRLICDVCKKSFDEPKLWVQHLETHTSTATAAASSVVPPTSTTTGTTIGGATQMTMPTNNTPSSANENSLADTLNKSYVPKKRRRVSQQENSMMDHVTLLCDLCNTSFDTPAEWVRHMNNQHTEIELALFNSKKDKEQKSTSNNASTSTTTTTTITTPTTTAITCSSSSRNHHQHQNHNNNNSNKNNSHNHHHNNNHHQQSHQQHHHKHQQVNNKKYSNRSGISSTQSRSSILVNESSNSTKMIQSSSPSTLEQQRVTHTQVGPLSNNSISPSPPSTQQ